MHIIIIINITIIITICLLMKESPLIEISPHMASTSADRAENGVTRFTKKKLLENRCHHHPR